jgi:hypothetical protein
VEADSWLAVVTLLSCEPGDVSVCGLTVHGTNILALLGTAARPTVCPAHTLGERPFSPKDFGIWDVTGWAGPLQTVDVEEAQHPTEGGT